MEASSPSAPRGGPIASAPVWVLAALPLALIAAAFAAFALLGGPGLDDRRGPPVEELAVERTVLRPGEIELTLRNTGPDPVSVAQVAVADAYVSFEAEPGGEIGRLEEQKLTLDYPWQEGSPYAVFLLTSTGATIDHEIDAAVETPEAGAGFFGLMAVLGTYVGVIPVLLGMLFLPLLRSVADRWIQLFLALTIGLLAFLALDGYLEGTEIGAASGGAFGGVELLFLGAALAFLALTAVDRKLKSGLERQRDSGASAFRLSLMVAIGIGLHNLGEGLAIGSAYAVGSLALGAFLVIGFALHNTTEGLAIVAPLAKGGRPPVSRLLLLGVVAGAPAILGAVIGASVYNQELATLLIGVGVGAIIQVIAQLLPSIRDSQGRALHPLSIAGIVAGALIMYATGLLISV
ncbi:MAG: putative metal cation transporter [Solirubrobacterales bacterium]|jgi:zinc transporter ZupT|nr:putative metal cation transporter [Solirubrobacterales bacterium]